MFRWSFSRIHYVTGAIEKKVFPVTFLSSPTSSLGRQSADGERRERIS